MRLDCGIEYFIGQKKRYATFSSELICDLLVVFHAYMNLDITK